NPEILKNGEDVYTKLNRIIPVDHDTFIGKATKKSDPYETIADHVSSDLGVKISKLQITGLEVYKERWRFYPGESTAAHTVGILGYKGNDFAGRYGLEEEYDTMLERTDTTYVNFFAQIFSGIKSIASASSTAE